MSALMRIPDSSRTSHKVRNVPIVLQKSQNAVRLVSAKRRNKRRSPIDLVSSLSPKLPVSFSQHDVVPHMITRSPRLRLAKFVLVIQNDFCNTICQEEKLPMIPRPRQLP
jgi:hypothetical protein